MDTVRINSPFPALESAYTHCALFLLQDGVLRPLGAQRPGTPLDKLATGEGTSIDKLPAEVRQLLDTALGSNTEAVLPALEVGARRWWARALPLPGVRPPAAILCMVGTDASAEFDRSLRQLERLAGIGTLAAGYAHEIRNSMVAGKTFVDLLLEKNKDSELAEVVAREMRRTENLIGQMLRFAGPARASRAPLQLRQVVQHSLQLVQHQFETKAIRVERAYAAPDDTVAASEYELQQAVVNLLLNALDATPSGGLIRISTAVGNGTPGDVRLAISDSGSGIAAENQAHLFEPFFTTKPGGTGLGLAITRRIIEEHKGRITLQSAPGAGATFVIHLPLAGHEPAA